MKKDPTSIGTRWRVLFERSLDGTLLADSAGTICAANPAACRLLGRSEQEIIEAGPAGISGTSNPHLVEAIRNSARTGDFHGEAVLRRKDGVEIPVEISSVVLTEKRGKGAIAIVFRDTVTRHDAMVARERHATLGSWEWDIASGEVFWSEHHYRMFGLHPSEFHPTIEGFLALVHPEDHARLQARWAKALAGEPFQMEFRVILPDSSVRHIHSQAEVDFDGAGTPVRMVGTSIDITERKRAEETLTQSEERFRRIIESTHKGVWLVDCDAMTTYVNPQMARMLGYASDEILGTPVWNYVFEEDRSACSQIFCELKRTQGGQMIEFRYRRKDGSSMWALVNTNTVYDREGQLASFLGMFTDITERKCLEEELRQRAEELQKVMDVAPIALLVARDAKCHEILANRAGNALFESEEGANLSLTPKAGTLPDCRFFRNGVAILPEELPLQVAAGSGVEVPDWEAEALMPSGARRLIGGHATPLRDGAGQLRGAVAAFQDITASRRRTDAVLRESEERFRNTADAAPVIMWFGDPQKQIIFFNKQVAVFTGLPVEQLLGGGWEKAIHPDDLESARNTFYAGTEKRASYQTEYRARRADGEYRHMLSTTSPRYIGDLYAGHVGTVIDITDLKRRQEEDIAQQKLESLGILAGGVAHDFNNLLGGILAQSELALSEIEDGASAAAEMENIREVAIRGAEIVRQLMIYAGHEADTVEIVDVSQLVKETLELLKLAVPKHAAAIRLQLGGDVPVVLANPAMLRQTLINLVTNASEAMGDRDGVIDVTTARVTVAPDSSAALPPGDYLRLAVSDKGRGMTRETQARIFDPFFTTRTLGRGLGLAVVRGIVERLGGEITVRSEPNQGTTFQILLPGAAESPSEKLSRIAATGEARAARGVVLMVDDENSLRIAVSQMLRKQGFTVLEAADGSAALEILRSHKTDVTVMLLDATLPGVASPDVLRQARVLRPDLRVILTSAHGEQKVAAMFAGLGLQPFIQKPYRQADIVKLLS